MSMDIFDEAQRRNRVQDLVKRARKLGRNLEDLKFLGPTQTQAIPEYLRAVQREQILPTPEMLDAIEAAIANLEGKKTQ